MNEPSFWYGLIAGGLLTALVGLGLRARPRRATRLDAEERAELRALPPTALERRARLSLAVGLAAAATLLGVLATLGGEAALATTSSRLALWGVWLAALFAWSRVPRRAHGATTDLDERDLAILSRAPAIGAFAVLGGLAVWSIALTELHSDDRALPLATPTVIFLSSTLVFTISASAAILFGSTGPTDAEG